jgi:hypothetical protein
MPASTNGTSGSNSPDLPRQENGVGIFDTLRRLYIGSRPDPFDDIVSEHTEYEVHEDVVHGAVQIPEG